MSKLERPYKAPRGWVYIAAVLAVLQLPFLVIGAIYINNYQYVQDGLWANIVGFGVLAVFFPLWIYSQHETQKRAEKDEAKLAGADGMEMQGK